MAVIAINSAHQARHIRGRLETCFSALRESLDAFVSHRMQVAAAEADHIRPQQIPRTSSLPMNTQSSPCN
jgi:hypothetical protein